MRLVFKFNLSKIGRKLESSLKRKKLRNEVEVFHANTEVMLRKSPNEIRLETSVVSTETLSGLSPQEIH